MFFYLTTNSFRLQQKVSALFSAFSEKKDSK
jgi:hypothetical protein